MTENGNQDIEFTVKLRKHYVTTIISGIVSGLLTSFGFSYFSTAPSRQELDSRHQALVQEIAQCKQEVHASNIEVADLKLQVAAEKQKVWYLERDIDNLRKPAQNHTWYVDPEGKKFEMPGPNPGTFPSGPPPAQEIHK